MVLFSLFQGNQSNRYVLLNSKVVDYINFILRAAEFKNCSTEKVNNLSNYYQPWTLVLCSSQLR